ncbi:glutathionylspermidine synthase [Colletotrichum sublineola]|nr:glutathionylspermidine synthase [Colletotrichum sublineola]
MRRVTVEKRPNATRLVKSQGLVFADLVAPNATEPYWPDNRYYSFTQEEVFLLEKATTEVFEMCCEAVEYLLEHSDIITQKMAIPTFALEQIKQSWDREPAWGSIYGRFDICFGGLNHPDARLRVPKFYEFNADTPTSLLETALIQWFWLEQTGYGNDQFNNLTERLVDGWKRNLTLIDNTLGYRPTVYFAVSEGEPTGEDAMNTLVLQETCQEAGWPTKSITMEEIRLSQEDGRFYDAQGAHIDVVFKLYPWEYMISEQFGTACFDDMDNVGKRDHEGNYIGGTIWIEPPYKMLWSNKALFAILWDLFKDDPRGRWLLPTYLADERPGSMKSYATKPIFSREGADIILRQGGSTIQDATTGVYGAQGYVVQDLATLPVFHDNDNRSHYPVLGIWVVDGEPAGMGIREDDTPITTNASVFVPHSIEDCPLNYSKKVVPDEREVEEALSSRPFLDPLTMQESDIIRYIKSIVF